MTPPGHRVSCEPTKKAVSGVTPAYKSVMEEAEARDGLIRNRIFLAKRKARNLLIFLALLGYEQARHQ
jgi:hypothetical protein